MNDIQTYYRSKLMKGQTESALWIYKRNSTDFNLGNGKWRYIYELRRNHQDISPTKLNSFMETTSTDRRALYMMRALQLKLFKLNVSADPFVGVTTQILH